MAYFLLSVMKPLTRRVTTEELSRFRTDLQTNVGYPNAELRQRSLVLDFVRVERKKKQRRCLSASVARLRSEDICFAGLRMHVLRLMLIVSAFVTSFMVTMRTGDDVGRFEASASCSQIGEKKDRRPAFFTGGDDIPLAGLRWKHFGATFYRVVRNNFARGTLT